MRIKNENGSNGRGGSESPLRDGGRYVLDGRNGKCRVEACGNRSHIDAAQDEFGKGSQRDPDVAGIYVTYGPRDGKPGKVWADTSISARGTSHSTVVRVLEYYWGKGSVVVEPRTKMLQ